MNYRRDSELHKKRPLAILLFAILLVLFLKQHEIFSSFFGGITVRAEPVLQKSAEAKEAAAGGIFAFFSFKQTLVRENDSLKERLAKALVKNLDYERLQSENAEMKALLGRKDKEKTVLAAVVARPNQSPYDTLSLDIGQDHGVKVGDRVLVYGNIIAGEIRSVSGSTSRVALFSMPGQEHEGAITDKNISLKLTGRGGGNFMAELPRGVVIEKGMQVFSVGLKPHLLAVVESVLSDPRNPMQNIILRIPINIQELRLVEVVI